MCRQFDAGQKRGVQTSFVKQLSAPSQLAEKGTNRPFIRENVPKTGGLRPAVRPIAKKVDHPKKMAKSMDLPN